MRFSVNYFSKVYIWSCSIVYKNLKLRIYWKKIYSPRPPVRVRVLSTPAKFCTIVMSGENLNRSYIRYHRVNSGGIHEIMHFSDCTKLKIASKFQVFN